MTQKTYIYGAVRLTVGPRTPGSAWSGVPAYDWQLLTIECDNGAKINIAIFFDADTPSVTP